jgi:preprotein translocase subunit SecB
MHDDEVAFVVELQQAGVFEIAGVAPEELPILLEVRCPEILLGFARQAVCDLVVKGGFPQLLINPVNFHALYSQKLGSNKRQVQD